MFQPMRSGTAFLTMLACLASVILSGNDIAFARKKSKKNAVPDSSQVSMCMYPVVKGPDGKQNIITKAGYEVHIPGLGIAPDANQIALYGDGQKNFWYVDKDGRSVKMTDQQVEWGLAQINQQAQARQSAMMHGQATISHAGATPPPIMVPSTPQTAYVQQPAPTVVVQNAAPASQSSAVGSAAVTGLAAAGGAMAGAAISNSLYRNNYYGVPYGAPVYHHGGKYYYNGANGKKVYVAPNAHYTNQWNQQNLQYQKNYRKEQYNNLNKNQQQMIKNQAYVNSKNRQANFAASGGRRVSRAGVRRGR